MQKCFLRGNISIGIVELSARESHHLRNVMRTHVGEKVVALNGKGTVAHGKLVEIANGHALIEIETVTKVERPARVVSLLQAILKNAHCDHIVREATAIGVSEIVFFEAQNTECRLRGKVADRLTRWETIAIEACKQSGNPFLPKISYHEKLEIVALDDFVTGIFGGLSAGARPLKVAIADNFSGGSIGVAIGPEGDFSTHEYNFLRKNRFVECRLSRNILRSETAAIYALCALDQLLTDD
ncbi:MAG: 16S rRNA (uracil(1498)-N(3))-methyltransferase [Puniceicoccales bacterium]|jgi:16S rRNA (uracil1498-N3)-methyltransferase|nr:16S rRNA (uracil(1498)-N(3))-methyltransferase [Puniceicoccales bacterium]